MHNLLPYKKFVKVSDTVASGTTTVNGTVIDTAGYEGICFLASLGTANAGNKLVIQQGTESDGSDMADTVAEVGGKTDLVVDVFRPDPNYRYVRATVVRGSASTVEAAWAILYHGRHIPEDSVSADLEAAGFTSPEAA